VADDLDAARWQFAWVFEDGKWDSSVWVEYALDVPMYFGLPRRQILDAMGIQFREFHEGQACPHCLVEIRA